MAISLPPTRLQPMGHYRNHYDVILPGGVDINAALKPEFWAHVGAKLKPLDTVTIFPEDQTRMVQAVVTSAGKGFAKLRPFNDVDLTPAVGAEEGEEASKMTLPPSLTVKYNGPHDKWTVIRESDNEKLHTGEASKEDAQRWADSHLRALAA